MNNESDELYCVPLYSKASIVTTENNQYSCRGDVVTKLGVLLGSPKMLVYNYRTKATCCVFISDLLDTENMK